MALIISGSGILFMDNEAIRDLTDALSPFVTVHACIITFYEDKVTLYPVNTM